MKNIQCNTQSELEAALKAGNYPVLVGDAYFEVYGSAQVTASDSAQVRAYSSAQVTAYGSAQVRASDSAQVRAYDSAQVTAYGSAQVTASDSAQVTAYGSAQVTASDSAQVRAYDSAQVTASDSAQVRAYGSAQVRAYGSAQVRAYGSAQVRASKWVAVTRHGNTALVDGGVLIQLPEIQNASEWCEFYGVEIQRHEDGRQFAVLFKGVGRDYKTTRYDFEYLPDSMPTAPDWDGGIAECGGGLHFSPRPISTLEFEPEAKHFMACPVWLDEIVVHPGGRYPQKVKAPKVALPCYEVDIDGNRL